MKSLITLLAGLAVAVPLYAQPVPLSEGTVRKLDVPNAKITLRHGPLVNLDMPPMTMVFRVQPPELMNGLKVGDTVRFRAESRDGAYVVTHIERAP
ncbi:MAG: copper-binding protein [Pseudomonadota bacterium]|jgi:Cu/Ag efflux protein CusF